MPGAFWGRNEFQTLSPGPALIQIRSRRFWSPGPRKSRFGTPPKPCRSRTQPRARCPRRRPRLPCTPARSTGGRGRRAPSVSWVCSRAFLRRFCPPKPQISTKFRRKEARKAPTGGSGGPPSPNGGRRHPPGPPRPGRGPGWGGGLINTARWWGALEACSRDSAGSAVPPVAPRTAPGTPPKPCRSRTRPMVLPSLWVSALTWHTSRR